LALHRDWEEEVDVGSGMSAGGGARQQCQCEQRSDKETPVEQRTDAAGTHSTELASSLRSSQ
ncbi:MAG TPA: hypothetical protein VMB34_29090, partial [Acetobacteraceae bacterium]|nr:hypothetical protein [Acetobacteraceae bacterium]